MKKLSLILLVDDDGISNYLHKILIEDLSLAEQVEIAYDGEEALQFIERYYSVPSNKDNDVLVLLDINMPGMDAFDFLNYFQHCQHEHKNLNIALLSSVINRQDKKKIIEYQILDVMIKPLTEVKMLKIVNDMSRSNTGMKPILPLGL